MERFEGLFIGLITFGLIGIFHPIVIKAEYYFGRKIWPAFLIGGLFSVLLSVISLHKTISILLAVLACCFFWSIRELADQEGRVVKGWFPENPKRADYYATLRENKSKKTPSKLAKAEVDLK